MGTFWARTSLSGIRLLPLLASFNSFFVVSRNLGNFFSRGGYVTKNRYVTHVKIREYANLVSSLLRFCNSILSRLRMLLQIACYCNITLFSIAGKF